MNIHIDNRTKARLAQFQYAIPNRLLQEDEVEKRRQMTNEELIKIFDRVWEKHLHFAIQAAQKCDVSFVHSKLKKNSQDYIDNYQEHRSFRISNLEFIVQLQPIATMEYELTQIWFIPSTDYNPQCILVCFDTLEERKRLKELVEKLNYDNEAELAKELIIDFLNKHYR